MAFRGGRGGRGGGRGGFGRGGFGGGRMGKELPFELFPEIEGLGKAEYSKSRIQLIKWSSSLHKYWNSSPYYYEDKADRAEKVQKSDIERYSDRNLQAKNAKPPLWHFIKLDVDHVPAELARGDKKEPSAKRVRWTVQPDLKKLDFLEKLELKKGEGGVEEEEDELEGEEEDEEFSDDGDYEQGEYRDDDEDDYNDVDDGDDEPQY